MSFLLANSLGVTTRIHSANDLRMEWRGNTTNWKLYHGALFFKKKIYFLFIVISLQTWPVRWFPYNYFWCDTTQHNDYTHLGDYSNPTIGLVTRNLSSPSLTPAWNPWLCSWVWVRLLGFLLQICRTLLMRQLLAVSTLLFQRLLQRGKLGGTPHHVETIFDVAGNPPLRHVFDTPKWETPPCRVESFFRSVEVLF